MLAKRRPSPRPADLSVLPLTIRVRVQRKSRGVTFSSLPLSNRLSHALERHAIRRLGDVDNRTVAQLLALRSFGRVSAWELFQVLKAHGHLDESVVFPPRPLLRPR